MERIEKIRKALSLCLTANCRNDCDYYKNGDCNFQRLAKDILIEFYNASFTDDVEEENDV